MKNELLFIWMAFIVGSLDTVEQWFRITSYYIGIAIGITAFIKFIYWWKNERNKNKVRI